MIAHRKSRMIHNGIDWKDNSENLIRRSWKEGFANNLAIVKWI